jgi:Fe-S-cluster containining protein
VCCKTYPIDIAYSDIVRWEKQGRKDILGEVSFLNNYPKKGHGGFYIEKSVRKPKQPCPFLAGNTCNIYDSRPLVCTDFPFSHSKAACFTLNGHSKKRKRLIKKQRRDMKAANSNFNQLIAILFWARN